MAVDYAEKILKAADIISKANTEALEYDKTIIAQITDNSSASRGQYTVSDGATVFTAYTDKIDYDVDDYVYVTIPEGNYAKQKMITGRYLGNTNSSYYTYVSPWKKFIDVTGDIIDDEHLLSTSTILANGDTSAEILFDNQEIDAGDGYTYIGVSAEFKTILQSLGTAFGTFGIRIYVTYYDTTTAGQNNKTYHSVKYELNNNDMYGNPYNFDTYYKQSKLFDISGIGTVTGIRVTLFQDKDFTKTTNESVPHTYTTQQTTFSTTTGEKVETTITKDLDDNILLQNLYLALGYSTDDFDHDVVLLFTNDSKSYNNAATNEENQKTLQVRWVHKDLDTKEITCYSDSAGIQNSASLHWYKYNLNRGISDKWAGNFWEEIPAEKNNFSYTIQPNLTKASESYKVVIETPLYDDLILAAATDQKDVEAAKEALDNTVQLLEEAEIAFNQSQSDANYNKYIQAKTANQQAQEQFDQISATYLTDLQLYESNTITFENENPTADLTTVDLVQGLSIICDEEGYNGIYYLYDSSNKIVNSSEASVQRILKAEYNAVNTDETDLLETADSITWIIPTDHTMIETPKLGIEYSTTDIISNTGNYCEIKRNVEQAGTISLGGYTNIDCTQVFRIKSQYSSGATNNTVSCIIEKNGVKYSASKALSFGPTGTNGTDYTFMIKMPAERHCLYYNDITPMEITASLLDHNNLFVDLSSYTITYDWYCRDEQQQVIFCNEDGSSVGSTSFQKSGEGNDSCFIRCLDVTSIPHYVILHAQISQKEATSNGTSIGTVLLDAYLPIPFSMDPENFNYIVGDDRIVYNTSGTCEYYYSNPYELYDSLGNACDVEWDIESDEAISSFIPTITTNGKLIPTSSFVDGVNKRIAIIAKNKTTQTPCWIQPLLLYKDVYTSALLNAWDGKFSIDEENGTIMSTMLGAGYKDSQNRYNGVLMGKVSSTTDGYTGTGVYGYHEGEQSFGLNIDGTAFLGKAGKGRIMMDGNSGSIQSMSYGTSSTGMLIDLDDGYIDIRSSQLKVSNSADKSSNESEETDTDTEEETSTEPDTSFIDRCVDLKTRYTELKKQLDEKIVNEWQHYTNNIKSTIEDMEAQSKKYENIIIILGECIDYLNGTILVSTQTYDENEIYYRDCDYDSTTKKYAYRKMYYFVPNSKLNDSGDTTTGGDEKTETSSETTTTVSRGDWYSRILKNDGSFDIDESYPAEFEATAEAFEYNLTISHFYYDRQDRTYDDLCKNETILAECANKGLRLSQIFTEESVLSTDLTSSYEAKRGQVFISATNPYLSIKSSTDRNTEILRISDDEYVLRSDNYEPTEWTYDSVNNQWNAKKGTGAGFEINLLEGRLDLNNFFVFNTHNKGDRYDGTYIKLTTDGVKDPYFQIHFEDNFAPETDVTPVSNDLLYIGVNRFELRSANWYEDKDDISKSHGMELDFVNNTLTAYDGFDLYGYNSGKIYDPNTGKYSDSADDDIVQHIGSYVQLSSGGDPYFKVHYRYNDGANSSYWKKITVEHQDGSTTEEYCQTIEQSGKDCNITQSDILADEQKDEPLYTGLDKFITNDLINISYKDFVLQSRDFGYYKLRNISYYTDDGQNDTKEIFIPYGTQIDLSKGLITSYSFELEAYKTNNMEDTKGATGIIQVNSNAEEIPLKIQGGLREFASSSTAADAGSSTTRYKYVSIYNYEYNLPAEDSKNFYRKKCMLYSKTSGKPYIETLKVENNLNRPIGAGNRIEKYYYSEPPVNDEDKSIKTQTMFYSKSYDFITRNKDEAATKEETANNGYLTTITDTLYYPTVSAKITFIKDKKTERNAKNEQDNTVAQKTFQADTFKDLLKQITPEDVADDSTKYTTYAPEEPWQYKVTQDSFYIKDNKVCSNSPVLAKSEKDMEKEGIAYIDELEKEGYVWKDNISVYQRQKISTSTNTYTITSKPSTKDGTTTKTTTSYQFITTTTQTQRAYPYNNFDNDTNDIYYDETAITTVRTKTITTVSTTPKTNAADTETNETTSEEIIQTKVEIYQGYTQDTLRVDKDIPKDISSSTTTDNLPVPYNYTYKCDFTDADTITTKKTISGTLYNVPTDQVTASTDNLIIYGIDYVNFYTYEEVAEGLSTVATPTPPEINYTLGTKTKNYNFLIDIYGITNIEAEKYATLNSDFLTLIKGNNSIIDKSYYDAMIVNNDNKTVNLYTDAEKTTLIFESDNIKKYLMSFVPISTTEEASLRFDYDTGYYYSGYEEKGTDTNGDSTVSSIPAHHELFTDLTVNKSYYKYAGQLDSTSTYTDEKNKENTFSVSWDGVVTADNLVAIYGGQIGPFNISEKALYTCAYGGSTGVYLGATDGQCSIMNGGAGIKIKGGDMTITGDIYLNGTIYGENWTLHGYKEGSGSGSGSGTESGGGGSISGWTINETAITAKSNENVKLESAGILRLNNNYYFTPTEGYISASKVVISSTDLLISCGSNFEVSGTTGVVYAKTFTVPDGGDTSGISLSTSGLSVSQKYKFAADGTITCSSVQGSGSGPTFQGKSQSGQLGALAFADYVKKKLNLKKSARSQAFDGSVSYKGGTADGKCPVCGSSVSCSYGGGTVNVKCTVSASIKPHSWDVTFYPAGSGSTSEILEDDIVLSCSIANG